MNMIDAIRDAGVVGAGGAGFPTHVKLNVNADVVILNGAECEPLLRVDQLAMQFSADKVAGGLRLAMEAAKAKRGVIATKAHYEEAVKALRRAIADKPDISLRLMDSYYPSGDEKSVIYEVTGQVVPTGRLPIDVGCVVVNVGTALNIEGAAQGKPVTHKSMTVSGDVPKPLTVTVPLGVSCREVLALSGFTGDDKAYALIVGGPLMGTLLEDWDTPVTKTTGGLIALKRTHPLIRRRSIPFQRQIQLAKAICCQCSRCTQLCPRHAMGMPVFPHKAMRAMATGNATLIGNAAGVLACSGCGVCTNFACEMGLAPSVVMTMLKQEMGKAGIRPQPETDIVPEADIGLKHVPVSRLVARMGLSDYDRPAPLSGETVMPQRVRLKLSQHVGKPAQPVVKLGDRVNEGQLIARIPDNALGAMVHASINGVVSQVTDEWIDIKDE